MVPISGALREVYFAMLALLCTVSQGLMLVVAVVGESGGDDERRAKVEGVREWAKRKRKGQVMRRREPYQAPFNNYNPCHTYHHCILAGALSGVLTSLKRRSSETRA